MERKFSGKKLGSKIRKLREEWGMSQSALAEKIGVSFQQVQKYEKGSTRVSVERLEMIAQALGIKIQEFFQDQSPSVKLSDINRIYGIPEDDTKPFLPLSREEISFIRLLRRIKNQKLKQGIMKQMEGFIQVENQ